MSAESMLGRRSELTPAQIQALPRKLLDVACRIRSGETLIRDDELVDNACHALHDALDEIARLQDEVDRLREDLGRLSAAHAAALALVADVRFAVGDYGKRMQPDLLEYLRGLAADASRYCWIRDNDDPAWRPFALRAGCSAGEADALVDAAMAATGGA